MTILNTLHDGLSNTTLYFALALGVWGLWLALAGPGLTPSYMGSLVIGQVLIVIEFLIGVLLLVAGGWPVRGVLHILYGMALLLGFPATFAYTRGRTTRYEALLYALVAFFLAGMVLRARYTGGGG